MGKKTARKLCYLVINEDGKLEDVDPIRIGPNGTVIFVMSNEHNTDTFTIELKDFKRRETMTIAVPNPLQSPPSTATLVPGEAEVHKTKIQPKNKFGDPNAGKLPYSTFKYTVVVTDTTAGSVDVYDPDIDIPPP